MNRSQATRTSGGAGTAVERFDVAVDRVADSLRGQPMADRLLYALSELGDWSLLWHTIAVARAVPGGKVRSAASTSLCLGIESVVVNQVIKRLVRRDRPAHGGQHPHALRIPTTSSFPSGHASSAVTAAWLLTDRARPGGSRTSRALADWTSGALAASVAWSRVHVGMHHASDVVGGVAVGMVLGPVLRRVARRLDAG